MTTALYKFEGQIVAVSPLAVSRPGDNFISARGSEKLGRLPRIGVKRDAAPSYFPATSLRRLLRESARNAVRKAIQRVQEGPPFSLETHMMLTSGVDTSNRVQDERTAGRIGGELELRRKNPLLSVFGRWRLAGHLHVGNAIPAGDDDCVYIEGSGARQNDFERNPEQAQFLSAVDVQRVRHFIRQESGAADEIDKIKATVKTLKREQKLVGAEAAAKIVAQIAAADAEIKSIKSAKDGAAESIKRPLEGFEAIRQGTIMQHCMRLDNGSELELGLLLASLREASRHPLVGGHRRLGCGEISGHYDVLTWPQEADRPQSIGSIDFGFDGFTVDGEPLSQALSRWDHLARDILENFDFDRFMMDDH